MSSFSSIRKRSDLLDFALVSSKKPVSILDSANLDVFLVYADELLGS